MGIYGYSFTSFLVTALLCAVPIASLQWVFIAYSALTSAGFLAATLGKDLNSEGVNLDVKKRLAIVGFICAVQITFLLIFKFYFFKSISY